jgi:hypothetical protein
MYRGAPRLIAFDDELMELVNDSFKASTWLLLFVSKS